MRYRLANLVGFKDYADYDCADRMVENAANARAFIDKVAQASSVGDVFDDAATGQGLLNYFLRAINCGAVTQDEATQLTSVTHDEFVSASFVKILKNRAVT